MPVLARREGRYVVMTVHLPLPPPDPDQARDVAACRAALAPIIEDYVRRYPAQCYTLAFATLGD